MPDPLTSLEAERDQLLRQISQLGDLRPGSITTTQGRCGNAQCHCHQPNDPGHGPNFRLTYKHKGKTITETFPIPAAQRKAEREIEEFRKFQQLSRALVAVNEKICQLRPASDAGSSAQEKKRRKPSSKKSTKK